MVVSIDEMKNHLRIQHDDENSYLESLVVQAQAAAEGHERWSTVGAGTNIIEASWRALVDSVEYGLMLAQ
jgi:2-isopropylmalate synthase